MRLKALLMASALGLGLAAAAQAKELKFAFQGTLNSLDPYNLNETFHLGFQGNIYEGLIRRGAGLEFEPALAERWEVLEPNRWRFHLRKGVKFHDGRPFTADDVLFSAKRVRADGCVAARFIGLGPQISGLGTENLLPSSGGCLDAPKVPSFIVREHGNVQSSKSAWDE